MGRPTHREALRRAEQRSLADGFELMDNERFALECLLEYARNGDIVDASNGEFCHCPVPECLGGEHGYWLTHEHHMEQGLRQSKDLAHKCFHNGDTKAWLMAQHPSGEGELWDIYREAVANQSTEQSKQKVRAHYEQRTQQEREEHGRKTRVGVASRSLADEQARRLKISQAAQRRTQEEKAEHSQRMSAGQLTRWISLETGLVSSKGGIGTFHKSRGISQEAVKLPEAIHDIVDSGRHADLAYNLEVYECWLSLREGQ